MNFKIKRHMIGVLYNFEITPNNSYFGAVSETPNYVFKCFSLPQHVPKRVFKMEFFKSYGGEGAGGKFGTPCLSKGNPL